MNALKLITLIAMTFCLMPLSTNAAGLWLYEQATPDMGSASAGRAALAMDASTASVNPAGMTRLDRSQLLAGFQMLYVDTKFDTDFAQYGGGDGGNAGGWVPAASFSYVHKVSPDLSVGVSVGSFFGLGLDYGKSWAGRYYVQEADFLTIGVNPGIGYRVNQQLSIGAGVSAVNSRLYQKTAIRNLPTLQNPNPDDGQLKLEDDDWGFGYNLGVLYEPNQVSRFGLTYRSEIDLEYKDTASLKGLQLPLSGIANIVGLVGSQLDMEMNLPQAVMLSAYHRLTERLAILGNIGWQEWSSFGESSLSLSSEETKDLNLDRDFDDTWHFALGFQYQIDDPWLLSVGIAYDESPVSDSNRTPDMPLDRQWRYATGIQYDLSQEMTIGCAYELLDAGDAEISQNRGALAGAIEGDYSSNYIHFFNVNLIKRF
ncbi:MAG: outer membrane protein transport protein [Deltaproteobacteria bacterium]|jgi:long-chain fatty acid transport protein|nr:outer membrane protein transport protein [Deltaproteobacteria bacterium]